MARLPASVAMRADQRGTAIEADVRRYAPALARPRLIAPPEQPTRDDFPGCFDFPHALTTYQLRPSPC